MTVEISVQNNLTDYLRSLTMGRAYIICVKDKGKGKVVPVLQLSTMS